MIVSPERADVNGHLTRIGRGRMVDVMSSSLSPEGVDLSVQLAGMRLANPVMTASGTSGYGPEYAPFIDVSSLGAFVTKAVTAQERKGNPQPRTVETAAGMLNAIGLANVGLERFVTEKIPFLATLGIPVIANVAGHDPDEFAMVSARLDEIPCISGVELNVSCPNVSGGLDYSTNATQLEALVTTVRPRVRRAALIVKLSPNVTDIAEMARAAVRGGAEALSMINTLSGMAINVDTFRPLLANVTGGLSGPAIKPVAIRMVHKVYSEVARDAGVPIIGMGGIQNWRDVVEFHLAGASAVAVGTNLFVDPTTPNTICTGLRQFLADKGIPRLTDLIGQLRT